jgi:hypothetical protein
MLNAEAGRDKLAPAGSASPPSNPSLPAQPSHRLSHRALRRYPPYIHALVLKENDNEAVTLSETKWPGNGPQGGAAGQQPIPASQASSEAQRGDVSALQQQVASLQRQVERLVALMERR